MDWGTILGSGSALGFLAMVARDFIRAYANRGKVSADAGVADAQRETTLSKATLDALNDLRDSYERRIQAIQEDARATIVAVRTEAANSIAASLHEVSTARNEASEARRSAAESERVVMRVRAAVWMSGPEDPRIARIRDLVPDDGFPFHASAPANGLSR